MDCKNMDDIVKNIKDTATKPLYNSKAGEQ